MSNFQEQSLDENAVILPVTESSPEFLHCEEERRAVERLLSAGPEAFYSAVAAERCGCFLSPQEVGHVSSWAQDEQQVQHQDNGAEGSSAPDDIQSTYFPRHVDAPAPSLELGWPEGRRWVQSDSITVHSSPPAEGEAPIRQIIRWHLQKAGKVIAIVTDDLTDAPIIGDLRNAASRGVPVYIILNRRSVQELVTLNKLKHPNMRVRVLGGKSFRSRTGRAVVGEMKDKFLLVDLETVIHGSYSLTWTDAHLHRQLVTVLRGPVVDTFDREFRILFAASLPVSDVPRAAGAPVERTHRLKDASELHLRAAPQTERRQLSLKPPIPNPPSPPADSFLDWEAMGVVHLFPDAAEQMPQLDDLQFDRNTPITDENQYQDMKRDYGNTSSLTNRELDTSTFKHVNDFNINPAHSLTEPELLERWDKRLNRAISRELTILDQTTTTRVDDTAAEQTQTLDRVYSTKRSESHTEETVSREDTTPSRKPLILRVPLSDGFSSCSDIMKRILPRAPGLFKAAPKSNVAEMSRSMMDLSAFNAEVNDDERGGAVSGSKASDFDSGPATPASALMQKRKNKRKTVLQTTPKTFFFAERLRSFGMNHMKALTKKEGDNENT